MSGTIQKEILLMLYNQLPKRKQGGRTMTDTAIDLFQFFFFPFQISGSFASFAEVSEMHSIMRRSWLC